MKRAHDDLPFNYVNDLLDYDHTTGRFFWKVNKSPAARIGKEAGTCMNGYVNIRINRKGYMAHRLAWLLYYKEWPSMYIDHINGIKSDNRIVNLRNVKCEDNRKNSRVGKKNKSGYKNIRWITDHKNSGDYWLVTLVVNGKRKTKMYKKTEDGLKQAIEYRNKLYEEHHKEFANYN